MDVEMRYRLSVLCTRIVVSFVQQNRVEAFVLPTLVAEMQRALVELAQPGAPRADRKPRVPPVPVGRSVTADYIISLETGGRFKSLKRHLTALGMTPAAYRERWNLPHDYPMVAKSFSAQRSDIAKRQGFGVRRRT